jgi:hypothetical protein
MPEKLIMNDFEKKNYLWQAVEKDGDYVGSTWEVPRLEAGFSSLQYGTLTADTDIAEAQVAMGTQSAVELWGTILVRESDLYRHGDMEKSYLKIMPDQVDRFVNRIQEKVSTSVLQGDRVCLATANGDASGNITVAREHASLFSIGEKVTVDDSDSSPVTGYIRTINVNTGVLTIFDARTGGSAVNLSAYTTAQSALIQIVGTSSEKFLSLVEACLPASLGGSDSLYGLTKANYTVLQSAQISGSTWTKATVLDDILAAYYDVRKIGRGSQKEVWCNYGMFKNVAQALETNRRFVAGDKKSGYGFNSVTFVGPESEIKLVAMREMPTDKVWMLDPSESMKFAGKEPFKMSLYDGSKYFMVRTVSGGPAYVSDIALRGNFVIYPNKVGVVHSIPSSVSA